MMTDRHIPAGLICERITDFSRLERLAPEWRRLFASTNPPGGVFQSWEWARAYWQTYGHMLSLCAPVVFAGDRVVGILPLALQGHRLQLLGAPHSDYNGALCEPDGAAAIASAMFATLLDVPLPWTECVLEGVPESSPLMQERMSLSGGLGARLQAVFGDWCPVTLNDSGDVFDRLSRKVSLRRHEKWLTRRGALRFRHIETRDEILGHLDAFVRFRTARRAMDDVESAKVVSDARPMLEALVHELDPTRELRFSVLELDERPVAYHFGFQHAGRVTWYMPAFDIDLSAGGPGEVLLRHLLKYAHEQRLAEFDFTVGDEGYKRRFANHVRQTSTLYFYRHPRQPHIEIRRLARHVRGSARHNARVVAYARPLLRRLRQLRSRLSGGAVSGKVSHALTGGEA